MSLLTNKGKGVKDDLSIDLKPIRGKEIQKAIITHLNTYHSLNEIFDKDIEKSILEDELSNITNPKKLEFNKKLVTFSPSSAEKCERELYYKAKKYNKDENAFLPYQQRWVRNGSVVHKAIQKDLLYAEKYLDNPLFTVVKMKKPTSVAGRPAWEHNLKTVKQFPELGFQIFGMMDGVLEYTKDNSKLGFEFKTKSTTIASIGEYKLNSPQIAHKAQVTAYSLLFDLDGFILLYESLAKDWWDKGEEARPDIRAFYHYVSSEDNDALIKKFARVTKKVNSNKLPDAEFPDKCIFCPYKKQCEEDDGYDFEVVIEEKRRREEDRKRKAEARKKKQQGVK